MAANTLTGLAADAFLAADIVGRELVGLVPSATINGGSERVALGDTVKSHVTSTPSGGSFVPSMAIPEGNAITIGVNSFTVNQSYSIKIPITGEEQKHLDNGAGYSTVWGDVIAQSIRKLANTIETYAWNTTRVAASRAFGTAGTNPFASDFNAVNEIRQILVDNGTPTDGQNSLVMSTTFGTKMRNLASLQQVNTAGNEQLLRQGTLLDLSQIMMKESAAPLQVTKGTGASYTTSTAGFAVGTTSIPLITGTGTVLAGDVITFAGDTNKYVVTTGISAPGTIVIAAPGLRQAIPAAATAVTVGNNYTPAIALNKAAVEVVVRPPAQPQGGDAAIDSLIVSDPRSGLSFEIAHYVGYGQAMYDIRAIYDVKVWKPDFVALLLG